MSIKSTYTAADILAALSDKPSSTLDVSQAVGCSRDTAKRYLFHLAEEGKIEKHEVKAGGRAGKMYIWMLKREE